MVPGQDQDQNVGHATPKIQNTLAANWRGEKRWHRSHNFHSKNNMKISATPALLAATSLHHIAGQSLKPNPLTDCIEVSSWNQFASVITSADSETKNLNFCPFPCRTMEMKTMASTLLNPILSSHVIRRKHRRIHLSNRKIIGTLEVLPGHARHKSPF